MLKWFKFRLAGLAPSRPRILQVAACALLAWSWLQTDSTPPPTAPSPLIPAGSAAATAVAAPEVAPQQAAFVNPAAIGASTIEVIVSHNDTLDRIFRRLKLDLADL